MEKPAFDVTLGWYRLTDRMGMKRTDYTLPCCVQYRAKMAQLAPIHLPMIRPVAAVSDKQ